MSRTPLDAGFGSQRGGEANDSVVPFVRRQFGPLSGIE
jgi:hypothetical protein